MSTHTVGQQQANVSQQSSSADTKQVVRRIENSEPIIFYLREGHDEPENHGIRVIHFYIGDDDYYCYCYDDEPCEEGAMEIEIENEESKVRRLGEERDDMAIIIDRGADVALFPSNMAGHGVTDS